MVAPGPTNFEALCVTSVINFTSQSKRILSLRKDSIREVNFSEKLYTNGFNSLISGIKVLTTQWDN